MPRCIPGACQACLQEGGSGYRRHGDGGPASQIDGGETLTVKLKITSSRNGTPDIAETKRRVRSEFKRSIAALKHGGRDVLSLFANLISIGLLYKNQPDLQACGEGN